MNMMWTSHLVTFICVLVTVQGQRYRHYEDKVPSQSVSLTRCGSYLNNSHGFIQTPNFPREFPLPISCQWLLHAPPGKKIVLYFTQYYMRQSLHLTEYDFYQDVHMNRGRHDLGEISFEVSSYTVYKPYLLLRFEVEEPGNIHLRVHQFLLDVYGFNITYEMVDDDKDLRGDDCFKHKCSFLGNCLASQNFESYRCHCFSGYFGDECQYGPYCDPEKGINMCKNGGKCRYFYGSLVNTCECPPAFEGVQCEEKKEGYNVSDSECDKLGCEHRCIETGDSVYHCECEEGYRLADDGKSCKEKGRMRYFAQVRFTETADNIVDPYSLCGQFKQEFLIKLEGVMESLGLRFIEKVSVLSVSFHEEYWYVDFILIGDKSENRNIWLLVEILVSNTTICTTYKADPTYVIRDAKPALHSMSLKSHDNIPVKVGDILTLVCEAKGSNDLRFEWFKDGAPVNVSRTNRNLYIMKIPKADPETRTSVLDIDRAHSLDAGVFTCRATDWNETKEKNLTVEIKQPPHIEVKPLSLTVEPGGDAMFECLSREDERGTFRYRWYREERQVRHDDELAEDIEPVGSRLTVKNAHKTATYTCVVESDTGTTQDNVSIIVVNNLSSKHFCLENVYNGIVWPKSPCGSTSIQRCPAKKYSKAVRQCFCSENGAEWADSDLTQCTSSNLEDVESQVTQLELGYVSNTTGKLLEALDIFLKRQDTAKPMMGDLQLTCQLLGRLEDYTRKYYSTESYSASIKDVVRLASVIMDRARFGNTVERQRGNIGKCILHLMELLRKDRRLQENLNSLNHSWEIRSRMMDMKVLYTENMVPESPITVYKSDAVVVTLAPSDVPTVKQLRSPRAMPLNHKSENGSLLAAAYKNIGDFLSNESLWVNQLELNSAVISSGPVWEDNEFDLEHDLHGPYVKIRFTHVNNLPHIVENISYCLSWQLNGNMEGSWISDGCRVTQVNVNATWCHCRTPGHFALARSTQINVMVVKEKERVFDVTVIGCIICLVCCLATIVIRLALWSESKPVSRAITLNLCCSLIVLNAVFIAAFHVSTPQAVCYYRIWLVLVLCYLASLSFLVLEILHLCLSNLKVAIHLSAAMATILGWGLPVLVFIAFMIVTLVIDRAPKKIQFCWLLVGRWELHAFIAIGATFLIAYCVMLLLLLRDICFIHKDDPSLVKRKYMFYMGRSLLLTLILTISCVMSIVMTNSDVSVIKPLFATSVAALGLVLLIIHGILYIKKCSILLSECQKECLEIIALKDHTTQGSENDTVKKFQQVGESSKGSKAALGGSNVSADEDPSDPYVRDRKYTKEHKEHLKSLLGTGSAELDFSTASHSRHNSMSRSTMVTMLDGGNEGSAASTISKGRHVANPKCACSKCGTEFPYKPARGRSYISDSPDTEAPEDPLLTDKAGSEQTAVVSAPNSVSVALPSSAASVLRQSPTTASPKSSPKRPNTQSSKKNVTYSPVKECHEIEV